MINEEYKGAVHLVLFAFAAICAAYNAGTAIATNSPRLRVQAAGYLSLAMWEASQVKCHWSCHTGA